MPHKLDHEYRFYDTPYGESYSVDTKKWYDDGKEEFPQPKNKPEVIEDFRIASLVGKGDWDLDDIGFCYLDDDAINLMVDVCFGKGDDDSYSFGWYLAWQDKKIVFFWTYRYTKRAVIKFLNQINKNQFATFYTDCITSYKLFSFPIDDKSIRLVVQDYTDSYPTFLQILFDGIVDKRYFVLTLKSVVQNAEAYLLDYVYAYAKENNIIGEALDKAVKIAKDKI